MRLGCGWGAVRMGSHTSTVMNDLSQASSVDCSKPWRGWIQADYKLVAVQLQDPAESQNRMQVKCGFVT